MLRKLRLNASGSPGKSFDLPLFFSRIAARPELEDFSVRMKGFDGGYYELGYHELGQNPYLVPSIRLDELARSLPKASLRVLHLDFEAYLLSQWESIGLSEFTESLGGMVSMEALTLNFFGDKMVSTTDLVALQRSLERMLKLSRIELRFLNCFNLPEMLRKVFTSRATLAAALHEAGVLQKS